MNRIRIRYMVHELEPAIEFYTKYFGFWVKMKKAPFFAIITLDDMDLILSTPFGPGGAAKPMKDGRMPEPGGWNRIVISVDDLQAEVDKIKKRGIHFRNEIATGPGGSEILLDDPSGNPVELFQPAGRD